MHWFQSTKTVILNQSKVRESFQRLHIQLLPYLLSFVVINSWLEGSAPDRAMTAAGASAAPRHSPVPVRGSGPGTGIDEPGVTGDLESAGVKERRIILPLSFFSIFVEAKRWNLHHARVIDGLVVDRSVFYPLVHP